MRKQKNSSLKSAQQGVVLIEALIAILIFSFGVLGIVGLQAAMVKNTSESKYRADASNIAQQSIGQMWSDPNNLPTTTNPCFATPYLTAASAPAPIPELPNGTLSITQPFACQSQYIFTITWQAPGEDQHTLITTARIDGA